MDQKPHHYSDIDSPPSGLQIKQNPSKNPLEKEKAWDRQQPETILKKKNKTGQRGPPGSKIYCKTARFATVRSGEIDTEIDGRAEKVRNGPSHTWSIDFSEKCRGH